MPSQFCISGRGKIISSLLFVSSFLLLPQISHAGPLKSSISGLSAVGASGSLGGAASKTYLPLFIGNMIDVLLGAIGIVFVVLIIQSGIQYMTSNGAEDKVKEAKKRIISAVIGIIILLGAYAISSYVITSIVNVVGASVAPAPEDSPDLTTPATEGGAKSIDDVFGGNTYDGGSGGLQYKSTLP